MTETMILIATLFFVGAFAGLIAGLFGVGGGLILVPAYLWIFASLGYENTQIMQVAVATSLATIVVTSVRSLMSHNKAGAVDWNLLKTWALPIAFGAIAAVLIAKDMKSKALMLIFACVAIIIAFVMFFGLGRSRLKDEMPQGITRWIYGIITGFLSTLMGIGGGSIAVPIMVTHGRTIHQAVGTASGFGVLIAVPSVIAFMITQPTAQPMPPFQIGFVNLAGFLVVVLATMITAPFGARMAHRLDAKKLKRYFAVFILIVALNMLRKALGV